jgi:hypothetical protein
VALTTFHGGSHVAAVVLIFILVIVALDIVGSTDKISVKGAGSGARNADVEGTQDVMKQPVTKSKKTPTAPTHK